MLATWAQQKPGWVLPGASLDMNFAGGVFYPSPVGSLLTCTRASTGYAETSSGLLVSFLSNIPRITDLGLLGEQPATNAILQSQTFDSATWVKTNSTVTADATTAPDGTTTADKLIASAGSAQHYVAQNVGGLTASEGRVVTVYAKYAGVQYLAMYMSQGPVDAWFDLQGGTVSNITGSASITALGNGWYRCQIYNSAATGTGDTYELHTAAQAGNFTHTGDGVNGIYLWGAQLERPTSFPTSYIPTTTVAVTRATDFIIYPHNPLGAGNFTMFVSVGGVAVQTGKFPCLISVNDGSGLNQAQIYSVNGGNTTSGKEQTSGVSRFDTIIPVSIVSGAGKIAMTLNGTAARGASNGGNLTALGTWTPTATFTQMEIGTSDGSASNALNGYVKRLAIFQTGMTDAQMQAITT